MDGYAMNMVMPTAISIRYDGRRILSLNSLKSSSGELLLLSMIAKTNNEIIDTENAAETFCKFEIPPVCNNVRPSMNAAVVAESALAPLISMWRCSCDACDL